MKSNILDFSVGNCEKVLLLFTRLPGELYFNLDGSSTVFMAEELEEELNSLLKLQGGEVTESREGHKANRSAGEEQGRGSPTGQYRSTNICCTMTNKEAC